MSEKSKSLVGGISILSMAGLICKVVGVLYRIPLAAYIGGEGMGIYSKVFPSYNLLLTISSAGIPVAISRLVSHFVTLKDPRNARRVFSVAAPTLALLGAVTTVLLLCGSSFLSARCGTPEARAGFLAIAPSLFFVCVMSAFRGYMQGHRMMLPTAVSQLIEQVGKVGIALPLAIWGMNRGGAAWGAAGALLGTSIAEAAALAYMILKHLRSKNEFNAIPQDKTCIPIPKKRINGNLWSISIPITLGACIVPLAGWIDSFMLTNLMEKGGMDPSTALIRYGLYSGMVLTLINVPTAFAMAMSTNLVPSIAAGTARKDAAYVAKESITGMRTAAFIGFPCAVGMSLLAKPILFLFYSGSYSAAELTTASELLQLSALTIGLFTMVQATSGILQGCGHHIIPMHTLIAGVACKILLNYTLIGIPSINIHGAPIASLVCYTVSMLPNIYYVIRYASGKFPVTDIILRPLAATVIMGIPVYVLWNFVFTEGYLSAGRARLGMAVAVCIIAGVAVYIAAALQLRAADPDDLPGFIGRPLKKMYARFGRRK